MSQELLGVADPYRLYYQKINANFDELYTSVGDLDDLIGGGQAKMEDGTAADPAYTFADDDDTGAYRSGTNEWAISTGGSYRAKVDAGGLLLVGKAVTATSTSGCELRPEGVAVLTRSGSIGLFLNRLASDGDVAQFGRQTVTVGSISVTGAATSFNTSSDRRLKMNIEDAPSQLAWLQSVQVREFEFVADPGRRVVGVIAQDHYLISPDAITPGDDGEEITQAWGNDPSKDVYRLVKVCQEMAARIEALEQQIGA